MAVASSSNVEIEAMDASTSKQNSDPMSSAPVSCSGDSPDRGDPSLLSSASQREAEIQNAASLRSEEYRQLFRLPPEEVLREDFNCACQDNILVQGHMYLFIHYICFYSNIFGFETKKIIHFRDVTSVKRAKTAGIFPNAIEIFAGGKKYFFASFLSRDEAFKLINDGWLRHGGGPDEITEKQESSSDCSFQENGLEAEKSNSFQCLDALDTSDRFKGAPVLNTVPATDLEDHNAPSIATELQDSAEAGINPATISEISSSAKTLTWNPEDSDAPKIPEYYSKVAESKFLIKVEEFFDLFFSDAAIGFVESFHERCGDKGFQCSSWYPHDQFGHARDVSFQHPIKIYFGAKFGSCREVQKFRVYRNSHLVIETSQEINDVPYGDHFRVEALWDVRRDGTRSRERCILHVYVNVAFSKKTMFKGKIVQSTLEECREAYAIWIDMAHELLKARNLEKQEDRDHDASMVQKVNSQGEANAKNAAETISVPSSNIKISEATGSTSIHQGNSSISEGAWISCTSVPTILKEAVMRTRSFITNQVHLSPLVAITFLVILLMQLTIVMLLVRPQNIHVITSMDHISGMGGGVAERSETVAWLEKRLYYLKDEMYMIEARLERMRSEHTRLKEQMRVLEQTKKQRQ